VSNTYPDDLVHLRLIFELDQETEPERVSDPDLEHTDRRSAPDLAAVAQQGERTGMLLLRLYREISAQVRMGKLAGALSDVGLLRGEMRAALELLDEQDAALGAVVHNECVSCGEQRAPGALQCADCQQGQQATDRVVAGALEVVRSTDPRWQPWRGAK
jgi:hypothetical protein